MLLLDGKPLSYDRAFTHEGIQYPANWLRLASYEEKTAIGIVEVANPPSYDQRFYWGPNNPKDHSQLVELWVTNTKYTAGTLLNQTDWYVTRNSETGVEIPSDVLERRSEIRSFCDEYELAIETTTSTDELAAYITSANYNSWQELPAPEEPELTPEPTPTPSSETIIGSEGDDSISFNSNTTSSTIQ